MPTFTGPVKGVSLSDAIKAAAAIAPSERVMLHCFEFYHPMLDGPFRFVNDTVDLEAKLESTAPVEASNRVVFQAADIRCSRPEESDSAEAPEVTLTISNISNFVYEALGQIRGSRVPLLVTERIYASDDRNGPDILPVTTWEISGVRVKNGSAMMTASYADPVNFGVPKTTIKRQEYPALER